MRLFLLITNNENFCNKENCFVRGRSSWMMHLIRAQNCSFLGGERGGGGGGGRLITDFNTINLLFQKGNHIQSPVKPLTWSVL